MQSDGMETNWAAENLQTIRTLMERSALYRRALAPVMTFNGAVGVISGITGWKLQVNSPLWFVTLWFSAAATALLGSFYLVRRQALSASEPFWSPPTRRVAQALTPAFFVGFVVGAIFAFEFAKNESDPSIGISLTVIWLFLYGCALHAAGAFMPRGIRWLSWLFVAAGCFLLVYLFGSHNQLEVSPHLLMGAGFGGLHLTYGAYLYATEKRRNET